MQKFESINTRALLACFGTGEPAWYSWWVQGLMWGWEKHGEAGCPFISLVKFAKITEYLPVMP